MQTAEEILNRDYVSTKENAIQAMIEFAKIHVKAALEAAVENVECDCVQSTAVVDYDTIREAYPLTNIK